jgi:SprT-like family
MSRAHSPLSRARERRALAAFPYGRDSVVLLDVGIQSAILFETPQNLFQRVFQELKPRTVPPLVVVEFRAFANANSVIRLDRGILYVRISDLLKSAPAPILEALAYLLVGKLYRKTIPKQYAERYRRHLNRKDMRSSLQLVRQSRGRKLVSEPHGTHYDLVAMFEELNFQYFHGLAARPQLGWSLRASRTILGHYDPSHNTIVLTKLLDSPTVPRLAVEYVLFHEMLHLRFPVEHRGPRRCVHTAEFKAAEREFPGFLKAKQLLKQL